LKIENYKLKIENLNIPIIVLNWNGIEDTLECLDALSHQTHQNYQVYLVDNGSKGNDAQILKETFGQNEKITLVLNEENLGFTKGNNEVCLT